MAPGGGPGRREARDSASPGASSPTVAVHRSRTGGIGNVVEVDGGNRGGPARTGGEQQDQPRGGEAAAGEGTGSACFRGSIENRIGRGGGARVAWHTPA